MLYYSRLHHDHSICYTCFYFYNNVVCETKVTETLSIKCIKQFVNTLNKIHFYVWSIDGLLSRVFIALGLFTFALFGLN